MPTKTFCGRFSAIVLKLYDNNRFAGGKYFSNFQSYIYLLQILFFGKFNSAFYFLYAPLANLIAMKMKNLLNKLTLGPLAKNLLKKASKTDISAIDRLPAYQSFINKTSMSEAKNPGYVAIDMITNDATKQVVCL